MLAKTDTIDLEAHVEGGLLKGFGRKLAGESLHITTFTAEHGPGHLYVTQALFGMHKRHPSCVRQCDAVFQPSAMCGGRQRRAGGEGGREWRGRPPGSQLLCPLRIFYRGACN